ncbi:phosphatidic acid phosphatase type 2 domain containing protein 1B, putative [Entamoeba invadens IP1]|uniref:Phosphatidic acid phosphatase type 2 domain containing protein 1B, putative n=1 Tax=Entamoeba invadens IP1 TaxID=370355 RepID=A0A0A1UC79_ENTIV|nr:phosphatidic acid phosphatase type 2 domain containing protein 1B, putative [Entamoeba invadens IP1]ELP92743.1 phosphatidic acid phosphatase type 2 domain containing protein 1B, putative [Entamoeba invadens IP1]|eukprot:XP_004259514.1 phosphatidic acid phosphatase type 2 domain containing protein 1B, putative [Entamoeba invadens IP1]
MGLTSLLTTFFQSRKIDILVTLIVLVLSKVLTYLPPHHMDIPSNHPLFSFPRKEGTFGLWSTITIDFIVPVIIIIVLSIYSGYIYGCFNVVLSFVFNDSLNGFLTQLFKLFAGRPRPFFFNGCDHSKNTCFKSFPSGHSSFAMAGLLFFALYIFFYMKRTHFKSKNLVCGIAFALPVLLAFTIAITRTRDHYHHFSDITGGVMLGGSVALISFFATYQRFYLKEEEDTEDIIVFQEITIFYKYFIKLELYKKSNSIIRKSVEKTSKKMFSCIYPNPDYLLFHNFS